MTLFAASGTEQKRVHLFTTLMKLKTNNLNHRKERMDHFPKFKQELKSHKFIVNFLVLCGKKHLWQSTCKFILYKPEISQLTSIDHGEKKKKKTQWLLYKMRTDLHSTASCKLKRDRKQKVLRFPTLSGIHNISNYITSLLHIVCWQNFHPSIRKLLQKSWLFLEIVHNYLWSISTVSYKLWFFILIF